MKLELVWDLLSWQEAFLRLRVSNGEGTRGVRDFLLAWWEGVRGDRGPRAGEEQNPTLEAHPPSPMSGSCGCPPPS